MDVVFSAVVKQGRRAPLTQIVPHCGESEGGHHEVRASLTNLESVASAAAGDAKHLDNGPFCKELQQSASRAAATT